MILPQTICTVALLLVCSLAPGLFFVRYLRWRPLETWCASVALSFLLIYLAALAIYVLSLSTAWAYATTAVSVAATVACRRDLAGLWRNRQVRAAIMAFLTLFAWILLLQFVVRNYAGGRWFSDWFEHYQRTLFFLEHQPLDTRFLDVYLLPARPPLANLIAAHFLSQVAAGFDLFQMTFTYLNVLAFLPCCLLAPWLTKRPQHAAWLIAGFLALNPMFTQNATYTWTKLFACFYELTGLALYLSAWRRNDASRMIGVWACLATALLVHYSAAPLILVLAGHYFVVLWRRRRRRWFELLLSAATSMAILATWFGWSVIAFGWHDTVASNSTVVDTQQRSPAQNLEKIARNTFNTLVPFPLRGQFEDDGFFDPRFPAQGGAYVRDYCFDIYQHSVLAMLGLGALVVLAWLCYRDAFHPAGRAGGRRGFWFYLIVATALLGIAVHGELDFFGVGPVCLQPLVLLGITCAAVSLPLAPRAIRVLALAGLLVDALLGVLLHFFLEEADFGSRIAGSRVTIEAHQDFGAMAINNAAMKTAHHLTFLADHIVAVTVILNALILIAAAAIWLGLVLLAWGGWGRTK